MANAKYVELVIKDEGMPRHWLSGYEVVSDHRSDGQRHLFLKRRESAASAAPKPKAKRRAAKKTTEPATAFPGSAANNG